jgi:hypothetical protein
LIDRSRWREELRARFRPSVIWPGPEVGDGWKDIVCDLVDALDAMGAPYGFVQLEEGRDGALVCLLCGAEDEPRWDEMHEHVSRACERSRVTCPRCGRTGCGCPTSRGPAG